MTARPFFSTNTNTETDIMKIRLLKSMGIDGKHTPSGTVIEADPSFAKYQASIERAEIVDENTPLGLPKKGKPAPAPEKPVVERPNPG